MQRIYHYLRGTVRLRLTGPYPERCCNLCAGRGIRFWNVTRESEESCLITVSLGDEGKVMALSDRAMCRIEAAGYGGLPGWLRRYRRRYGLAAGLLLVTLLFALLGRVVLVIEVEGNERLTRSEILSQLQSCGFSVGSYGPAVDVRQISNRMLLEMEELSFLTVNLSGVRAQVIVRERDPAPEVRDPLAHVDVAAARDGVIREIRVISGRAVAEPGQAVRAGEVLISSLITHERADGSGEIFASRQIRAEGSVTAYTLRRLSASTPLTALVPTPAGEAEEEYGLKFLSDRFNFSGKGSILDTDCDKIAILYPITLPGGETLPLGLWKTVRTPFSGEVRPVDRESAEGFLRRTLEKRMAALVGDGEILQTEWLVEQTEGAVTVTLEAQCLEEIGTGIPLNEEAK